MPSLTLSRKRPALRSRLATGMPGRLINTPEDGVARLRREMPKLKTKSGVKKRFKLTANGKLKGASWR